MRPALQLLPLFLSIAIFTLTYPSDTPGQQSNYESLVQQLGEKSSRYRILAKELIQVSKTLKGKQSEIGKSLAKISWEANDIMDASADLVYLFSLITEPESRRRANAYIPEKLDFYAVSLGKKLKTLNGYLSFSKSRRISATGVTLRDEIRSGRSLLRSIANQLH